MVIFHSYVKLPEGILWKIKAMFETTRCRQSTPFGRTSFANSPAACFAPVPALGHVSPSAAGISGNGRKRHWGRLGNGKGRAGGLMGLSWFVHPKIHGK